MAQNRFLVNLFLIFSHLSVRTRRCIEDMEETHCGVNTEVSGQRQVSIHFVSVVIYH
jgi:hypothetical protein